MRRRLVRLDAPVLAVGVAVAALACGQREAEPEPGAAEPATTGARTEATASEPPSPTSSGHASASREDPFVGVEALRPQPWTGWPLENVDIETEAGWRIDPVDGGYALEQGLVLAADPGAFVLAIAPGEVVELAARAPEPGSQPDPSMLELTLAHGDGIESHYGPLTEALVHRGLPVSRGAAIGLTAGRSLRLRVTVDGVAIDPLLVLRQPLHRWPALTRDRPPPATDAAGPPQ